MQNTIRTVCAYGLWLSLLACGGDNTGPNGAGGANALRAEIDGQVFSPPVSTVTGAYTNRNLVLMAGPAAGSPNTSLQVDVVNVTGVGTYPLSAPSFGTLIVQSPGSTGFWASSVTPGINGTVTVTLLSAARVTGTFSFVARPANASAYGQKTVSNGTFDIRF